MTMTWKKITVDTGSSSRNTDPLYAPDKYTVDEKCSCCGSDLTLVNDSFPFRPFIKSITTSKFYNPICHKATCIPCLNEHPPCFKEHADNPIEDVVFNENTKSWVNLSHWFYKTEWENLDRATE